ncbi:MAG: methyltransferase type 11 [uncultured bacterium]|nr:MAG: methyltransferase type 11 [uncultured bacterium]HBH18847.1 class I SAM-dependent methyltransferase [Cyanobacteria bacterium UBA9579]
MWSSVKDKEYYTASRPEIMEFIPDDIKTILEVGCGEGNFGYNLKNKLNAEVWGIELNPESAKIAKDKLNNVLHGDINLLLPNIPDNYFDCIVFNDVLEHLVDPVLTLKNIKSKLSKNGAIISSIPNMRYITVLSDLVINKDWYYTDSGILDSTHLRFFTKKSIIRMFEELDYKVVTIKGISSTNSLKFYLWNLLSLGLFLDSKYRQFACVAKQKH